MCMHASRVLHPLKDQDGITPTNTMKIQRVAKLEARENKNYPPNGSRDTA